MCLFKQNETPDPRNSVCSVGSVTGTEYRISNTLSRISSSFALEKIPMSLRPFTDIMVGSHKICRCEYNNSLSDYRFTEGNQ